MGDRARSASTSRFAAGLVGLFVASTLGWLVLWAAATSAWHGSAPVLVASGSMGPTIRAGDLVVLEPYHSQELAPGQVIQFVDPDGGGTVLHRIAEIGDDGEIRTKGDANAVIDSNAVEAGAVTGVGQVLVPRAGLPVLWWRLGDWLPFTVFAAVVIAAIGVTRYALLDEHDPWRGPVPVGPRPALPAAARQALDDLRDDIAAHGPVLVSRRLVLRRGAELTAVGVAGVFLASSRTAWAAFTDTTANPGSTFGAGTLAAPTGLGLTAAGCSGVSTITATGSTTAADTTTGASVTIPRPLGAQAGDVLIAQVDFHTHDFVGTITAPSGWTTIRVDNDTNHEMQGVFWKLAGASEPATYTFVNTTGDTNREGTGAITSYRGVDRTNPVDAHAATTYPGGDSSIVAPSVTTTMAGTKLLALLGQRANGPVTAPTGMTKRYEINAGNQCLVTMADENRAAVGATGTRTFASADNGSSVVQTVALRPIRPQLVATGLPGTAPNGNAGSLTLVTPAGVAAGDVLIAHVVLHGHSFGANPAFTAPSGWSTIRTDADNAHITAAVLWRVATASEPATHTFTNLTGDTSQQAAGAILAYRGADTVAPVAAHGGATTTTSGTSISAPSVSTTVTDSMLLSLVGLYGNNHGPATAPAGMTKRYERTEVDEGNVVEVLATAADQRIATTGATGTRTTTVTSAFGTGAAQAVALRPPTGSPFADLTWTPSTSGTVDGYVVERWVGTTLQSSTTLPATAVAFTDGPLVAGTTYTYRVYATDGSWRSAPATTTYTPASC